MWTTDKPTTPGWYWYREPGLNLDTPCPAWVFDVKPRLYATVAGSSRIEGNGTGLLKW